MAVAWVACGSNPSGGSPAAVTERSSAAGDHQAAPGFSLLDTQGKTVALADFKGRVVFIDFWASWCPPCRISIPEVEKLWVDYKGKPVQVLGLNLDDDPDAARRFADRKKIQYPVLLAGGSDAAAAYGVEGIPHFALVDAQGRLVQIWSGFAPGMGRQWRAAINTLLES